MIRRLFIPLVAFVAVSVLGWAEEPFEPFTGKVTRNKVRMRLNPNLEGPILQQLTRGDLLVINGESEDFYSVAPPMGTRAYVFRTFVLDGMIEGSHVNIRLEPDLNAPVITQLNSGAKVDGKISPLNSKWLEIDPPEDSKFFIAKEFIEKVGDASYLGQMQMRKSEVEKLLAEAALTTEGALQQPFAEIDFDHIATLYNNIITQYTEFAEVVDQAKVAFSDAQIAYIEKKVEFAESIGTDSSADQRYLDTHRENEMERRIETVATPTPVRPRPELPTYVSPWSSAEEKIFDTWQVSHPSGSIDDFYEQQRDDAELLEGVLTAYDRPIKNKPGDYLLVDADSQIPIAYLYSTSVELSQKVGQATRIKAAKRPNNHFAFPAYYVLSIE